MPQSLSHRITYCLLLTVFVILGTLFAWRLPDWQAPDEPAHYNYISQVAAGVFLPVIEMGDWDNDYLETLKAQDFAEPLLDNLDSIQYEDHQPPLYYWLATPIFLLTDGNLFAVRMVSVVMTLFTVALSYAITLHLFPNHPHRALAVMALVAFLPQNIHMLSSINNDALAGLMIALTTLLCVRYLQHKNTPAWWLGLAVGIIFITKTTGYFMAGVVTIVIVMRWLQTQNREMRKLINEFLAYGIPVGIFAVIYWGRNILTYSFPDFLGLQAHDEVVVGQLRRVEHIADIGNTAYWNELFYTTVNSFWGQFGWMEARLADALPIIFQLIIGLVIVGLVGLLVYFVTEARQSEHESQSTWAIWIMLGFIMFFALAQYAYYNVTFVQFQGRYLFVAIIPFAIGLVTGVDTWRGLIFKQNMLSQWIVVAIFVSFAVLDLYLIWRVIPCAVGC